MIFSSFISGADRQQATAQPAAAAVAEPEQANVASQPEGATDRLKRLLQASASRLVGLSSGSSNTSQGGDTSPQSAQTTRRESAPAGSQAKLSQQQDAQWQLERKYTLSEVQQHSSLEDCWMVIFDKVYNITEFVYEHPGGDFILLEYAGRDATHPFLSSRHGSSAYKMLDKYWIGILVDEELYYSNKSSYCSAYSSLSWRSTPTLEVGGGSSSGSVTNDEGDNTVTITATSSELTAQQQIQDTDDSSSSDTATTSTSVTPSSAENSDCETTDNEEEDVEDLVAPLDSITLRGNGDEQQQPSRVPTLESLEQEEQQQQRFTSSSQYNRNTPSPLMMIEYKPPQEKEEDADSDFGDFDQRECNTCGGGGSSSPSSAALVALATTSTQPKAIVRSWSSSGGGYNSAAAQQAAITTAKTTTSSYLLTADSGVTSAADLSSLHSSKTYRWRASSSSSSAKATSRTWNTRQGITRQYH